MIETLFKLMDIIGPSGDEDRVRDVIKSEIKKHVNEVYVDKFGNLIAHKKGNGQKVMLAAHMDEVGLMAKNIEQNGFIRISEVGSIEPITLVGQQVSIMSEKSKSLCNGVITFKELHEDKEIKKLPKMQELYVDTGLSQKELKKLGVEIGDYIVPSHHARFLGSKKMISGKALDDRIGCYILMELAKKFSKVKSNLDVYYVFTVQEEIGRYGGMYGAKTSTYTIAPDWGLAIDVTNAKDASASGTCLIGNGPVITIKDAEILGNKILNEWLKKLAKANNIPLQPEVEDVGTTDATNIMLSRGGIPASVLAVAVRNIHSTVGIANIDDIEHAINLLFRLLSKPPRI